MCEREIESQRDGWSDQWGHQRMREHRKLLLVGGSIASLSCAHALVTAGWEVIVVERSQAAPSGSPSGAGRALNPQS